MAGTVLKRLSQASFALACVALGVILLAYLVEIAARYGFNRPTTWSVDLVSYGLAALIFLAMPEITRGSGHVAITSLIERLPPARQEALARLLSACGAALCAIAAWIAADAALGQWRSGIETVAAFAIPKWWLTALAAYGFALSAANFALLTRSAARAGVEI